MVREERKRLALESVDKDFTIQDNWTGLKQMKKNLAPKPYHIKDSENRNVETKRQAETAAEFLASHIWGSPLGL